MICVREGWTFRTSNSIVIDKAINALDRYKIEDALLVLLDRHLGMWFMSDNAARLIEETLLLNKNLSQKKVDVLNGIRQFYRQK